jgi:hypothetical protein
MRIQVSSQPSCPSASNSLFEIGAPELLFVPAHEAASEYNRLVIPSLHGRQRLMVGHAEQPPLRL